MRRIAWLAGVLIAFSGRELSLAAESVTAGLHPVTDTAAAAPTTARRGAGARAALPAANFLVEWRLQPAAARPSPRGDVVITSDSATIGGATGFGPGAVVVGTARAAVPQALRVANGKEGAIQFDRSQTHTVYDMAWTATASASSSTDGSSQVVTGAASSATSTGGSRADSHSHQGEVQSHEVVVHSVEGLRVTPHWTRGDTLELEVALTHAAPAVVSRNADAGARAGREIDFHSTVQASFDEWLTVASVGDGGDELQIRVTWR